MSNNPLLSAYKIPSMYISLPSGGRYYTEKPKLSVDGELAIYAMTARDEIISKTPDALFNGEATVALLTSCCPDITDPKSTPVNDLMVLLLAIRKASYGDEIDIDMKCPKCNELNMLQIDINRILGSVKVNHVSNTLTLQDKFDIKLKPYNINDRTIIQIQQIQQERMIQELANADLTDAERNEKFGKTFVDISTLTIDLMVNCITSVSFDENEITDVETIREWLHNISSEDYKEMKTHIEKISDSGIDTNFKAACQSCAHEWESEVELDIANFFAG
jgi:phage FluMu protein Com